MVNEAQRKLEALVARSRRARFGAPAAFARARLAGCGATAAVVAVAMLWLPLGSAPVLAFAQVQEHFRDFRTLRFDVEQRMNGKVVMKSRVSVTRDGNVRTDVGDVISVIVNSTEMQVLTLHAFRARRDRRRRSTCPRRRTMRWPGSRIFANSRARRRRCRRPGMIGGREGLRMGARDRRRATSCCGPRKMDLPLEMTLGGARRLQLNFDFEFDPQLAAQMFSTEIPAGYSRGEAED